MITWISIDDSGYKGYIETQKGDVQVEREQERKEDLLHIILRYSHFSEYRMLLVMYLTSSLSSLTLLPTPKQRGKRVEKKEIKQAKRSRCQKDLLLPLPNVYFLFFLYTATYCFSYTAVRIILPSRSYSFLHQHRFSI